VFNYTSAVAVLSWHKFNAYAINARLNLTPSLHGFWHIKVIATKPQTI
jgi:hypothetical protein